MSNAYEFACHSKACAPPPAGTGGSLRGGRPVYGAPKPLRNATTGRINPSRARAAFQTTGVKSAGSKRTEHIGATPVTSKTVKGRKIQHVATGGRAKSALHGAPIESKNSTTKLKQRNILAEVIARVRAGAHG